MVNGHRSFLRAGIVTAVMCWTGGAAALRPVVHAQIQRQVFASVTNPDGSPVLDVIAGDVKVTEDGQECDVLKLDPVEIPTKVTLLVDNGPASSVYLSNLRNGLQAFFAQMPQGV